MTRRLVIGALLSGALLGLGLGLTYTWVLDPIEQNDTSPAHLRAEYRYEWVRLVALSYAAGDSLELTRARLRTLSEDEMAEGLERVIEDYADRGSPQTLRRLTTLAEALDVKISAALLHVQPPASDTLTPSGNTTPRPMETLTPARRAARTPTPKGVPSRSRRSTATVRPTSTTAPTRSTRSARSTVSGPSQTPTPTSSPTTSPSPTVIPSPKSIPSPTPTFLKRLTLQEKHQLCDPDEPLHIEVIVEDTFGRGVPGAEVWLTWAEGVDRAVTGLKPDEGLGYVDFSAQLDRTYAISVGQLGMPVVSGLQLEGCVSEDGETTSVIGSWRLVLAP